MRWDETRRDETRRDERWDEIMFSCLSLIAFFWVSLTVLVLTPPTGKIEPLMHLLTVTGFGRLTGCSWTSHHQRMSTFWAFPSKTSRLMNVARVRTGSCPGRRSYQILSTTRDEVKIKQNDKNRPSKTTITITGNVLLLINKRYGQKPSVYIKNIFGYKPPHKI